MCCTYSFLIIMLIYMSLIAELECPVFHSIILFFFSGIPKLVSWVVIYMGCFKDVTQRDITAVLAIFIVICLLCFHAMWAAGNKASVFPQFIVLSFFPCSTSLLYDVLESLALHIYSFIIILCCATIISQFISTLSVIYRYDTICGLLYHM